MMKFRYAVRWDDLIDFLNRKWHMAHPRYPEYVCTKVEYHQPSDEEWVVVLLIYRR